MALTSNQGLELPDGTDNANVPLAMTQYNAGSENRLVQRYLSIADRTARNATPNEGELSYLADLNRYDFSQPVIGWVTLLPAYAYAGNAPLFTSTSTVYTTAGAPVVGVSIVAPPSGVIRVGFGGYVDNNNASQQTLLAPQLNAGSVVGAGATVVAASDDNSARQLGQNAVVSSSFIRYSGLTAGNAYNAFLMHRVSANTGSFANRVIEMEGK